MRRPPDKKPGPHGGSGPGQKSTDRAKGADVRHLTAHDRQRLAARLDELAALDRLVREVGALQEPEVAR